MQQIRSSNPPVVTGICDPNYSHLLLKIICNTLRLNFWHLKIIRILDLRYQPRINGHALKNKQKMYSWGYTINHNENEDLNEKRSYR